MIQKRVPRPERLRTVPRSFSWIDHRLIRDGHLERLQIAELLLYFFLVLVGDAQGVSYYSLRTIVRYLKLSADAVKLARKSLVERSLIAYSEPFWQVLSIPERAQDHKQSSAPSAPRGGEATSIGEIFKKLFKEDSPNGR